MVVFYESLCDLFVSCGSESHELAQQEANSILLYHFFPTADPKVMHQKSSQVAQRYSLHLIPSGNNDSHQSTYGIIGDGATVGRLNVEEIISELTKHSFEQ